MASRSAWSQEDLDKALLMVKGLSEGLQRYMEFQRARYMTTTRARWRAQSVAQKRSFSAAEESVLVEWALEIAKIGCGCTREQIAETVKWLLDKDGRLNPFVVNCPGRDWWYGFLHCHPELSFCSPEQLQHSRASACSKERLTGRYRAF